MSFGIHLFKKNHVEMTASVVNMLSSPTTYIPEFGCAGNHLIQEAAGLDSVLKLMSQ